MDKEWKIIYYEDNDGYSEVFQFIDSQKLKNKAKIMSWISELESQGPILPRPYADLLTHGFMKNTQKVPSREIEKAIRLKYDFLSRYTKESLQEEYDENL